MGTNLLLLADKMLMYGGLFKIILINTQREYFHHAFTKDSLDWIPKYVK